MTVLDTHAWVWYVADPGRLSERATATVDSAIASGRRLLVSSISAWEVALLVARGRLRLSIPVSSWISRSEALPFLEFVPVTNAIALRSVGLPHFHADPADRMIVVTAIEKGACVVTRDQKILGCDQVDSVW